MKPFTRVLSAFAVGILLQGGVYLYLDQYMFAPTTDLMWLVLQRMILRTFLM